MPDQARTTHLTMPQARCVRGALGGRALMLKATSTEKVSLEVRLSRGVRHVRVPWATST
jgi:hypothetical protein